MSRLLAVVVGCDYTSGRPDVPALTGAESDARALAARLAGDGLAGGRLARLTLLLGDEASTAGFRAAVQGARATQAPDDSLLVYFAGHGLRDASGLILYTADSTYPVADLLADLGEGGVRRAVVLDCCHAGAIESALVARHELGRVAEGGAPPGPPPAPEPAPAPAAVTATRDVLPDEPEPDGPRPPRGQQQMAC